MNIMRLIKVILVSVLCAFVFCACSPSPVDVIYDVYASLEYIMRSHLDEPDALIAEINAYADANRERLRAARKACDEMGRDRKIRMIDQRLDELNEIVLKLANLDLEIQDRLEDDPVRLDAYRMSIRNINFISPENDPRVQGNM